MKIDVNEHRQVRLRDVFEPVEFWCPSGESVFVAMRDGCLEITTKTPPGKTRKIGEKYLIRLGQCSDTIE